MADDTHHRLVAASLVIGAPTIGTGSEARPARQRQRKPTLARALREAAKAGVNVAGATIENGKVTLQFGEPVKANEVDELDKWIAKRHAN
jgi:hypothetical protein